MVTMTLVLTTLVYLNLQKISRKYRDSYDIASESGKILAKTIHLLDLSGKKVFPTKQRNDSHYGDII